MKFAALLVCLLFFLCASACGGAPHYLSSVVSFKYMDGNGDAESHAVALLDALDEQVSTKYADSDISRLNRAEGGQPVLVGEWTARLLLLCKSQFERTGGLFSPSLYALSELWGFSDKNYRVPSQDEISEILSACDFSEVEIEGRLVTKKYTRTKFDLGGIAKGFALQLMRESLLADEVTHALVELAGCLLLVGEKPGGEPFRVAVSDPLKLEHGTPAAAILELRDCYVSTSSDTENFFEQNGTRYCHILDPRTGAPAETDVWSATVVVSGGEEGGALSDLLSTALYLMGMERAVEFAEENGLSVFLLDRDGRYYTNLDLYGPSDEVWPGYVPL